MQQIYKITPMPKCNFNKVALQLKNTSEWLHLYDELVNVKRVFQEELEVHETKIIDIKIVIWN